MISVSFTERMSPVLTAVIAFQPVRFATVFGVGE